MGSSSGSFLNRLRLSASGKESRLFPLKSGDIIQLGVDYQGRQEGTRYLYYTIPNIARNLQGCYDQDLYQLETKRSSSRQQTTVCSEIKY